MCVMILSTMSAGSSALQKLLCQHMGGKHIERTTHYQFETLYWTKAAAILGREQVKIPNTELPLRADHALRQLAWLLDSNVPDFHQPRSAHDLVFQGWRSLCRQYGPVFIEKSPHHLHQWSSLDLILQAMRTSPDVQYRFIGLVRNPMDALYSMWRRWRACPDEYQHHWMMAYENLRRLQRQVGDQLLIVRYEDLSPPGRAVDELFRFIGEPATDVARRFMHGQSVARWRSDWRFGFQLTPAVQEMAESFGYTPQELANDSYRLWPVYRDVNRWVYRNFRWSTKRLRNRVRSWFQPPEPRIARSTPDYRCADPRY
jgi:hypothetical protein